MSRLPLKTKNQHIQLFDAIDDDLLAHGETAQAGTQILVAVASNMRVACEKIKTLSDGINYPVGSLDAATFLRDVVPDVIEFRLGFWCDSVRHQRGDDRSLVNRLRPRCFTSSPNCRMDS